MNQSDLPRIVTAGHLAATTIDRLGKKLLAATRDWQSPLRSGGARGPKGDIADPTGASAVNPDDLAREHDQLVADLAAFYDAATRLTARLERLKPIDPNKVQRGRVNSVPTCLACDGPAPRCRRGLCDACYTAWLREDRPDMQRFRRDRQAALVPSGNERVDPTDLRVLAQIPSM